MGLEWLPRDDELKDHGVGGEQYWGGHGDAPCTVYEKKPLLGPEGKTVDGLYTAWITLNNPRQYNSYTTEMVKGVIAGFANASLDRSVVAVVFTGAGDRAFCTGGNTKEYAEYYARRPHDRVLVHGDDGLFFDGRPGASPDPLHLGGPEPVHRDVRAVPHDAHSVDGFHFDNPPPESKLVELIDI